MGLILQSLALDRRFLKVSRWSFAKKFRFLGVKYRSIIWHFYKPFELGKSYIYFDRKKLFYDSKLGLAGYQSMLSRHQYMLQIAHVKRNEVRTIVDCGANVGFFSLMVHDLFPKANIYAIEPVPETLECLRKNTNHIKQITCSSNAISDTNGTAYMNFDEADSVTSQLSSDGTVKVKTLTLDNYCKKLKLKKIDILKIDTESFEAHVLRGSPKILEHTKYLFLEVTLRDHGNYTLSYIMSLLYSKSYDFQLVAFRNYANKSEGQIEVMDCLLLNKRVNA